ncbi:MAG: 5-formyltetrahydrofolate cyclo-ligase [Elainella sp.]
MQFEADSSLNPNLLNQLSSPQIPQPQISQPPSSPPELPKSDLSPSPPDPKAQLRRSLLKARQSLPAEVWRTKSERLSTHLQASPWLAEARTVLAYISFRQEPDLGALFAASSHRWGLPRCVGKSLNWHLWAPEQFPLQAGSYGILEPDPASPTLEASEVDLILVPAVACDVRGYRLGYGGGFYDRLLSHPDWANIPTIGIVFEFARLPRLPIDPWDRPMRAICTEVGLFEPK